MFLEVGEIIDVRVGVIEFCERAMIDDNSNSSMPLSL